MQRTAAGYETDFALWAQEQAAALREGRFADVDIENVSEEIESLARRDRSELRSRLTKLMLHLLKFEYQPGKTSRSWRVTIVHQAIKIEQLLMESPSLKSCYADVATTAYRHARREAATETGLPIATFPETPTSDFEKLVTAELEAGLTP